jgi:hypothetical protein
VEGKKIIAQQTIAETFNDYFVAVAENVKRQRKISFINDDNNSVDNRTHFMEQAFHKPYPSMDSKYTSTKETEQIITFLIIKTHMVRQDIHKDSKTKRPFRKLSNKFHV